MSDFLYGVIGVFLGILAIVTLLTFATPGGQGATARDRILSTPILAPTLILHYFLPYGLIILTLFMDIMSQLPQGVFGVAIGFGLMVLNWVIGRATSGVPDFVNDLCEIPGMKGLASKLMPQNILFVSTIVTYLAMFATVSSSLSTSANVVQPSTGYLYPVTSQIATTTPSPSTRMGASWGLAFVVIVLQLFGVLATPGCLTEPLTIFGFSLPPSSRAILAVIVGTAFGAGSGYGLANSSITQPSYTSTTSVGPQVIIPATGTPSSTQARGPGFVKEQFQLGAGLGEMPMPPVQGGQAPIDIAKSSGAVTPGESSDQFVCEAYKNGQLVTSTLVG